jgi:hypothetical protein
MPYAFFFKPVAIFHLPFYRMLIILFMLANKKLQAIILYLCQPPEKLLK